MDIAEPYYQTPNAALAVALSTCGVPHPTGDDGKVVPLFNVYDADCLAKLGYKGWKLEDAARDAFRRGLPGRITYNFLNTNECRAVTQAWQEQEEAIRGAMSGSDEIDYATATGTLDIPIAAAAKLCCQFAKNRRTKLNEWKLCKPMLAFYGDFSEKQDVDTSRLVSMGSVKAVTLDAPREYKERVGV